MYDEAAFQEGLARDGSKEDDSTRPGAGMRGKPQDALFSDQELILLFAQGMKSMMEGIEGYESNTLLNTSPDDLATYFAERFALDQPAIAGPTTMDLRESKIRPKSLWDHDLERDKDVASVPSTEFIFQVPMTGDLRLLRYQPSLIMLRHVVAHVVPEKVYFIYNSESPNSSEIQTAFQSDLARFRELVERMAQDVDGHNARLRVAAKKEIEKRRERLLRAQQIAAEIGIPLRQHIDAVTTYVLPDVRRKAIPTPPVASTAAYMPEPAIEIAAYEHILGVIGNMVLVMERSPGAFSSMGEEDLRTHFLVQLNGQYEGRASGETFSGSGSTDILLLEGGRSVFIAECKFWKGPASLTDSIEQILDYAIWRDGKLAILLFNRNQVFSDVIAQVKPTTERHPLIKRSLGAVGETAFRFILRQRDDPNREMTLTVIVFDVPTKRSTSKRLKER